MERDELLLTVDRVLDGSIYLSKEANDKILQQFHNITNIAGAAPTLTRREKEILLLLLVKAHSHLYLL